MGYQTVADSLRERIRRGEYTPGSLLPTERELQETYGVSRSTVRRAISALAESGWAEVMPKRGVAAQFGPAEEIAGNVAYIDHAHLVNERVFFGLSRAFQGTKFQLVHVDSCVHGVEGAIEYAAEKGFVAAFVWSKEGFPDAARIQKAQKNLPIIALDHGMRGVDCDLVTEANLQGTEAVVRHLATQGRKNIAISGMIDMLEINHERFSGFLKGQFVSGLHPVARNFVFCQTSGNTVADTSLLATRLADEDRPDAIFVLQDMCVPPVVEAIFDAGLRIPEDVAVASFGGEMPIQIDEVGLTSVAIDWSAFVQQCVETLQKRLRQPSAPSFEVVLPVELLVRGSCGAPASEWNPFPTQGAEAFVGPRWQVQRDHLSIRSKASRNR